MGHEARTTQRRVLDAVNEVIAVANAQTDQIDKLSGAQGQLAARVEGFDRAHQQLTARVQAQGLMITDIEQRMAKQDAATAGEAQRVREVERMEADRLRDLDGRTKALEAGLREAVMTAQLGFQPWVTLSFLGRLRWLLTGRV